MTTRLFIALCFIGIGANPVWAWTEDSISAIAHDAKKLMPSNLQWVLSKYEPEFISGYHTSTTNYSSHRELIEAIMQTTSISIDSIKKDCSYPTAAQQMGRIARLVGTLHAPFPKFIPISQETWRTDYNIYLQKNQKDFRIRWPGIRSRPRSKDELYQRLTQSAERIRKMASILSDRLEKDQKPISSYDSMSVPFGVGSVSYSNAVSNTAMSWLLIWDQSGGINPKYDARQTGIILPGAAESPTATPQ